MLHINELISGVLNLQGFFGGFLPRKSRKCMIQFDKHLPNWSRYPERASQDSSECLLSHRWLRHSAVGAPGAVDEYGHHLLTEKFHGKERTKNITFFSRWWFQNIFFISLPRFLGRWSYLINISQMGCFNHQLVLVVPSSFFFQFVSVQKLPEIQSKTSHPKIGWYFFTLGSRGVLEKRFLPFSRRFCQPSKLT